MNHDRLSELIENAIQDEITPSEHEELQSILKRDSKSRRLYRERMDIEAALRTWAEEGSEADHVRTNSVGSPSNREPRLRFIAVVLSSLACLVVAAGWYVASHGDRPLPNGQPGPLINASDDGRFFGSLRLSNDGRWAEIDRSKQQRFREEHVTLETGVAELLFDSGTNLVLEAPCELAVLSADTARLIRGSVYVNVTDRSNGFILETPETTIYDEGTEYAVALEESATEVHVFEGSVLCVSDEGPSATENLVEAGEAYRFDRRTPGPPGRVPFGQRKFVRQLDAEIQQTAGDELLAYDGFENIAGRIRRGRSGFGWDGGWTAIGRKRGPLAKVVPAPSGTVFEVDRNERMCLKLSDSDLRRKLNTPKQLNASQPIYVSFLLNRDQIIAEQDSFASFRISMEPKSTSHRRRFPVVAFGISSEGFPYINCAGNIEQTAIHLPQNSTLLIVLKMSFDDEASRVAARIYQQEETVDTSEPDAWTIQCDAPVSRPELDSIRLSSNGEGDWLIDELRISTSWFAAVKGNMQ